MAKKYLKITELIQLIEVSIFEGSVDKVIGELDHLRSTHQDYWDLKLVPDVCAGGEVYKYELWGTRDETDKERDKRLTVLRKARANKNKLKKEKEAKELEEYKRLKKKYEAR